MGSGVTPPSDAGFTLIELLVVVTVLSILTISIGLSMSFARLEPEASDDAGPFIERFAQLQAQAIHSQTPQGIGLVGTGWRIQRLDPKTQVWSQTGRVKRWQGTANFTKPLGQQQDLRAPQIVMLPDGRSTPFEITFRDGKRTTQCQNDGWTGVQCSTN